MEFKKKSYTLPLVFLIISVVLTAIAIFANFEIMFYVALLFMVATVVSNIIVIRYNRQFKPKTVKVSSEELFNAKESEDDTKKIMNDVFKENKPSFKDKFLKFWKKHGVITIAITVAIVAVIGIAIGIANHKETLSGTYTYKTDGITETYTFDGNNYVHDLDNRITNIHTSSAGTYEILEEGIIRFYPEGLDYHIDSDKVTVKGTFKVLGKLFKK